MRTEIQELIREHSLEEYPNECCGFIVLKNKQLSLFKCENISKNPKITFVIKAEDYLRAHDSGEVTAYYHSHPIGDAEPSMPDKVNAECLDLMSYIYSVEKDELKAYIPDGYIAPLQGRVFCYGILDCYTLVCDYYKMNFDINLNNNTVRLSDADVIENDKVNVKINELVDSGSFRVAKPMELETHDIVIMKLGNSRVENHFGVYIGDGILLHHLGKRNSCKSFYGEYWKKVTTKILKRNF